MKMRTTLFAILATVALVVYSLESRADLEFGVNPNANWLGFINVYDQADNFQFGFAEGTAATASANWAAGPALPLTLSPNTRLYDENVLDPFWVDQGTFEATLVSEFNYYQETFDADPNAFIGQIATFSFDTIANSLPAGYEAVGFIKVLDGFSSWATYQITTTPLVAGQAGNLNLIVDDSGITGAGTPFVQAGFWIKGAYVSSSDPVALTGVDVTFIPEPSTFALLGGFAALGLIIHRRCKQA